MGPFIIALVISFISELGDKFQLVAVALASKYGARLAILGLFVATLTLQALNTFLGLFIGKMVSLSSLKALRR